MVFYICLSRSVWTKSVQQQYKMFDHFNIIFNMNELSKTSIYRCKIGVDNFKKMYSKSLTMRLTK